MLLPYIGLYSYRKSSWQNYIIYFECDHCKDTNNYWYHEYTWGCPEAERIRFLLDCFTRKRLPFHRRQSGSLNIAKQGPIGKRSMLLRWCWYILHTLNWFYVRSEVLFLRWWWCDAVKSIRCLQRYPSPPPRSRETRGCLPSAETQVRYIYQWFSPSNTNLNSYISCMT